MRKKDIELEAKDKQIFNFQQSMEELQLMITSLKGHSVMKQEFENKCGKL